MQRPKTRREQWQKNAKVGDPKPCVLCGRPAILRSPDKGAPCHMVCAQQWHKDRDQEW